VNALLTGCSDRRCVRMRLTFLEVPTKAAMILSGAQVKNIVVGLTNKLSSGGAPVSYGPEKRIMPRRLLQRLVRRAFGSAEFIQIDELFDRDVVADHVSGAAPRNDPQGELSQLRAVGGETDDHAPRLGRLLPQRGR
jgi:hypothetical protein